MCCAACRLLFAVCCLLIAISRLMFDVRCVLSVVWWLMFVFVVGCFARDVWYLVLGAWCLVFCVSWFFSVFLCFAVSF